MPHPPTRLATCVHEAGHAVVQLARGSHPWIDSIAVDGLGEGMLGLVDTISIWQPSYLALAVGRDLHEAWAAAAWRDVINYLAGPVAELRWRRYSRVAVAIVADEMAERCFGRAHADFSDFGRVRRRLKCAIPGDDRANFVQAWLQTEEEVARWWREIVALARVLSTVGRIEDVELYELWTTLREENEARAGRRRHSRVSTSTRHGSVILSA